MYNGKLGVGIISFDRPKYFSRLMESLTGNSHLENTDFHLFQDGVHNRFNASKLGELSNIVKCIDLFNNSSLSKKSTHIKKDNVGIAVNQFEAYETLTANYEYVLILEDDVVLSPYFLRLIRVLIDQFKNEDKVFSISLNFRRACEKKDIASRLDEVFVGREHWWAECFAAKKWQIIRPTFMKYYELVKDVPYYQRPRDKILELFHSMGFMTKVDSQDAAKEASVIHAGMLRVNSTVNRGFYIGKEGVHFRPAIFNKLGFADQEPYIFEEDKTIKEFKVHKG